MGALPDEKRWFVEPADTEALILDLRTTQRVRSFGYNMVGPYPAEIEIAVSDDGIHWNTLYSTANLTQHHDLLMLNDIETRFVRLSLGQLIGDNPYYGQLSDGAYQDYLMVGVMRADSEAYWDEPILLVTNGSTDYDDAQFLRDDDPQTSLTLPGRVAIPESDMPYRYLRLHLDGDLPLDMTEARLSLDSP
jgi:hypothetical protein